MRPKELQEKLGITADRIKFYKKQDLFFPENPTSGNKPTVYTDNDLQAVKVLEVLTKSGFTCGDIKKMQDEGIPLAEVARQRMEDIQAEIKKKQNALFMLTAMVSEGAEFETLDTDHYWDVIHGKEADGEKFIDIEDQYSYHRVSLIRDIECPWCGKTFEVDLEDYLYDESSDEGENVMGPDCVYSFDSEECQECPECGKPVKVSGWIREYPIGAYDSEDIDVEAVEANEEDE